MLKDDFYTIAAFYSEGNTLNATLQLNAEHAVFKGHFPGQPVVPGVCLMQMVKEVLATELKQPLMLTRADYLKFIVPVIPKNVQLLKLQLKYNTIGEGIIRVAATFTAETVTCFKFQGYFKMT